MTKKLAAFATLILCLGGASFVIFSHLQNHTKPVDIYPKPLADPVNTLDPRKTRIRHDYLIAKAVFGQFLELDEFGSVEKAFIDKWSVSADGRTYTFFINPHVLFHSGRKATVKDAIFSIHYLASPDSLLRSFFENIAGYDDFINDRRPYISGIEAVDERSFIVRLKRSSYVLPQILTDPKIVVLPENLDGKTPAEFFTQKNANGIGPYRLDFLARDGTEVHLARNENYYKSKPRIARYVLRTLTKSEAIRGFKDGSLYDLESFAMNLDQAELAGLRNISNAYSVSGFSTTLLFLNGYSPVFQSAAVRRLIKESLDYAAISQACGQGMVPAYGIIPDGLIGWLSPHHYAPSFASGKERRAALALLHSSKKKYTIYSYGSDDYNCIMRETVRQLHAHLNVDFEYKHVSLSQLISEWKTPGADIAIEYLDVRTPEPIGIFSYFSPRSPHNLTHFMDPEIDRRLDRLASIPISSQRALEYRDLNDYISNRRTYAIPLLTNIRKPLFRKFVRSHYIPSTFLFYTGFDRVWIQ